MQFIKYNLPSNRQEFTYWKYSILILFFAFAATNYFLVESPENIYQQDEINKLKKELSLCDNKIVDEITAFITKASETSNDFFIESITLNKEKREINCILNGKVNLKTIYSLTDKDQSWQWQQSVKESTTKLTKRF